MERTRSQGTEVDEKLRQWVLEQRGNMTMQEFSSHIYRYRKDRKKGIRCSTVHRNTVSNWVNGKTVIERDVEVFLSLILMKYDEEHPQDLSMEGRNKRYFYAREKLNELIGVDLYCRHLHDAMLIELCRNVLNFAELPEIEMEFENELKSVALKVAEKDEYAMERNTIFIGNDLCKVKDLEDLKAVVAGTYRNTFASASRTIGSRLDKIYQSRENRYGEGISATLAQAIDILAPNYRDSYIRMYTSSFISRKWMIDLCRHLKFDDDEIDQMLEAAHMASLSGEEKTDSNALFKEKSMHEKLECMLMLGMFVDSRMDVTECPPVECLLEAFTLYEYGGKAFSKLDEIEKREEAYEDSCEELKSVMEESLGQYAESMFYHKNFNEELYKACRSWKQSYFGMDQAACSEVSDKDLLLKLHLLAALIYTILTGQEYKGSLTEKDLVRIKDMFDPASDGIYVYRFLSQILGVFLSGNQICEQNIGGEMVYSVINEQTKQRTEQVNMESILADLWESILTI